MFLTLYSSLSIYEFNVINFPPSISLYVSHNFDLCIFSLFSFLFVASLVAFSYFMSYLEMCSLISKHLNTFQMFFLLFIIYDYYFYSDHNLHYLNSFKCAKVFFMVYLGECSIALVKLKYSSVVIGMFYWCYLGYIVW
jgi:hypothetical protein